MEQLVKVIWKEGGHFLVLFIACEYYTRNESLIFSSAHIKKVSFVALIFSSSIVRSVNEHLAVYLISGSVTVYIRHSINIVKPDRIRVPV